MPSCARLCPWRRFIMPHTRTRRHTTALLVGFLVGSALATAARSTKLLSTNPADYTPDQFTDAAGVVMDEALFTREFSRLTHKYGQMARKEATMMSVEGPDITKVRSKKKVDKAMREGEIDR